MENTIVQLSKYVITFLMICFTVQSFAALKERDEDERHYILMRQIIMIILMNFICFFVMFLQEGEVSTRCFCSRWRISWAYRSCTA